MLEASDSELSTNNTPDKPTTGNVINGFSCFHSEQKEEVFALLTFKYISLVTSRIIKYLRRMKVFLFSENLRIIINKLSFSIFIKI